MGSAALDIQGFEECHVADIKMHNKIGDVDKYADYKNAVICRACIVTISCVAVKLSLVLIGIYVPYLVQIG